MNEKPSSDSIVPLPKGALGRAAEIATRAFFDDPFAQYMIPDPRRRSRRAPWFFRTGVRYGWLYGEAYTTPNVEGVSLWLPPGRESMTLMAMIHTGMLAAPLCLGLGTVRRLVRLLDCTERLHAASVQGPHWYLFLLAVDPACQSRGLGGALIRRGLARADQDGLPCYVETSNPDNPAYYQRHGFRPAREESVPGGPRLWSLVRAPD